MKPSRHCRPLFAAALFVLAAASPVSAGPWAERAGRLNQRELTADAARQRAGEVERERRNRLHLRRIRPATPGTDWNADPTAIPYALYQINKRTGLPVFVDNDGLDLGSPALFDYTVVYLTAHSRFTFNEKEVEHLREWLRRGGTLFLDDCYIRGSPFTDSVRPEVNKLFPGAEPVLLLEDDPHVADAFKLIYPTPWPGAAFFENRPWQYFLIEGRPAIFFSPNDDGCGWEISTPPSASNPIGEGIGHGGDNRQREVMYQWLSNWLLFAVTH